MNTETDGDRLRVIFARASVPFFDPIPFPLDPELANSYVAIQRPDGAGIVATHGEFSLSRLEELRKALQANDKLLFFLEDGWPELFEGATIGARNQALDCKGRGVGAFLISKERVLRLAAVVITQKDGVCFIDKRSHRQSREVRVVPRSELEGILSSP